METIMVSKIQEKEGMFIRWWRMMKGLVQKLLLSKVIEALNSAKKLGREDPRRVTHSIKVGLAISLVSTFYYLQPFYNSFGVTAMWAVVTVVVVFEFSVGATLGKGLNRGIATLFAGALGVGAYHLAILSGKIAEPLILGLFIFVLAAALTFMRFFPSIKARYDYGLLIFILTFSMVSVTGFRNKRIIEFAFDRLLTTFIGFSVCVIVSIFAWPVWAGEDLHNLVALNLEKLGSFLEGFGDECFRTFMDEESKKENPFMASYKSVLNSRNTEETLANHARWEPGHGQFMYRHPWKQYLKIGIHVQQCAFRMEALNGYLESQIHVPRKSHPDIIQETCLTMTSDSGKALKELASAIRTMTSPSMAEPFVSSSKSAAKSLESLLKSGLRERTDIMELLPVATVASLLIDVVACVENIDKAVAELASHANFKGVKRTLEPEISTGEGGIGKPPANSSDCRHVVVTVDGSNPIISS